MMANPSKFKGIIFEKSKGDNSNILLNINNKLLKVQNM